MKKIVFLSVLSITLMTGCHPYGAGIIIDDGYGYQPMPPAHAPAHGRRHHRYYYYPNAEIYFDIGRNMYFYLNSVGAWTFSINLPIHLRSHLHNGYVEIEMEQARPYLRHKYYRNKYKKHKKYKRILKNERRYNNNRKYRNDGILRQDRKNESRQYKNKRKYKNEQRNKYKENKSRKKQEKYERDDDDNKRNKKSRRNELY